MGGATSNSAATTMLNNNGPASSPGGRVAHTCPAAGSAMFSAAPQSGNVLASRQVGHRSGGCARGQR